MKKLLLLAGLLLSMFVQAQDYDLLTQLKKVPTQEIALSIAQKIVNAAPGYHYYKSKEFRDYNIFLVVYAPDGVTNEQIEAQKNNDNCIQVYYKGFNNGFAFDKIVASYTDIYQIWKHLFKKDAVKNNDISRISEPSKDLYYSLSKQNSNWVIKG